MSARAHSVTISSTGGALRIEWPEGSGENVPASALCSISDNPGRVRVGRRDVEGWSLLLDKPLDPEIAELLPKSQRYGRWIDRIGLFPALVAGGLITASVVAIGYVAPHWLAPHVPMSWERNVGGAIVGDFGNLRCHDTKGQQALEALVERVAPGSTKGPDAIKVAALDVGVFNAAALPGGYYRRLPTGDHRK